MLLPKSRRMAPRERGWHNHSRPQGRQTREIEAFGRPRVFEGRRVAELLSQWSCACRGDLPPVRWSKRAKERPMWPTLLRNACILAMVGCVICGEVPAQTAAAAPQPASPRADYRVVVWYRRDRPLDTFKYQTYDMRKGEYTPAVDAWLELMRSKHPAYLVAVRDVDLSRERGATESLKVGSVIMRELTAAASLEGIVVGGPVGGGLSRPLAPRPGLSAPPTITAQPCSPTMGPARSVDLDPPPYTYPIPVPYPRPHP